MALESIPTTFSDSMDINGRDDDCHPEESRLNYRRQEISLDTGSQRQSVEPDSHEELPTKAVDARRPLINEDTEKESETPLHLAAYRGDIDALKSLIDGGADINAKNPSGRTALHIAVSTNGWGESIAVELINRKANLNLQDNDGQTALHIVSKSGNLDLAELLLFKEADVNIQDNEGKTALHIASEGNIEEMVVLLINNGAQIDSKDQLGETPLYLAIRKGKIRLPIIKILLESIADANMKDSNGLTPLQCATIDDKADAVQLLLRYYIDIDLKDGDGHTALHLACFLGHKDIAELLLEHGADAQIVAPDGTATQIATRRGRKEILELLRRYEANPKTESVDSRAGSTSTSHEGQHPKLDKEISYNRDTLELKQKSPVETQDNKPSEIASLLEELRADNSHWNGVRRDNGDGFILAKYENHDVFFDAKLESIGVSTFDGEEMHAIQLKLNFMKPFSTKNRIRYAKVDVALSAASTSSTPHIHTVMPQADRVEVSEQEITSGQKLTVGASGNGGPSSVNISMEGSKERKSTFKGVRIIHGAVKDKLHASWRLYEEPGSKSGLPEIVRLLLVVQCEAEFMLQLSLSVKVAHFSSFGIPRTLTAREGSPYQIPKATTISSLERAARLRHMMNVASRTASIVETAKKLEKGFAQSINNDPKKKALIMEAGDEEDYVQEWMDLADASKSEFYYDILHEKLLRMEALERRQHRQIIIDREDRTQRREYVEIEMPTRERSRSRDRVSRFGSPTPIVRRENLRSIRRRFTEDGDVERGNVSYRPSKPRNAVQSFSAVGPGYNVARLS